jgi:hypothetical protein
LPRHAQASVCTQFQRNHWEVIEQAGRDIFRSLQSGHGAPFVQIRKYDRGTLAQLEKGLPAQGLDK